MEEQELLEFETEISVPEEVEPPKKKRRSKAKPTPPPPPPKSDPGLTRGQTIAQRLIQRAQSKGI